MTTAAGNFDPACGIELDQLERKGEGIMIERRTGVLGGIFLALALGLIPKLTAAPIDDAVALLNAGRPSEAHVALQGLLSGTPSAQDVARIRYYDALALFEMEKFEDAIEAIDAARGQSAELTPEQRLTLNSKLVRAHYAEKNFENVRTEAQTFLQTHGATAGTTETKYMRFIHSKAMWDMARKDYIDAARAHQRGRSDGALKANGAAKMQQFLDECNAFTVEERAETVMPKKMSLDQMKWHARILAGEEEQLAAEMENAPSEDQVAFAYYRAWAHYYFWSENRMENHAMMKAFAEAHPDYEWAPRARYFAARCLHAQAVELGKQLRSLKYDDRTVAAAKVRQEAIDMMNAFVEECREGETLGAFSLDLDGETDIGRKYAEICTMMREQDVSTATLEALSPEDRARTEYSLALGFYGIAGPDEWQEALDKMSQCAANPIDEKLQREAVDYSHRIKYEQAVYQLRQAFVGPAGAASEFTTATAEFQEGISLVNQCIADFESAMGSDLLPADPLRNRKMEECYWECRFIAETGDDLLTQSAGWSEEKQARLTFTQLHAYYHSNQWTRFRETVASYRALPGLPENDLLDVEQDLFASYEYTREFDELVNVADTILAQKQVGTKGWANALNARAIGKTMKPEPDLVGAAADLDQVLAANIEHADLQNHIPTRAAFWRAYVAEAAQDTATLRSIARMIRDDMPDNPYRMQALERYADALQ
jgi:hypothetical protein